MKARRLSTAHLRIAMASVTLTLTSAFGLQAYNAACAKPDIARAAIADPLAYLERDGAAPVALLEERVPDIARSIDPPRREDPAGDGAKANAEPKPIHAAAGGPLEEAGYEYTGYIIAPGAPLLTRAILTRKDGAGAARPTVWTPRQGPGSGRRGSNAMQPAAGRKVLRTDDEWIDRDATPSFHIRIRSVDDAKLEYEDANDPSRRYELPRKVPMHLLGGAARATDPASDGSRRPSPAPREEIER